jgi:hypothetical protein
MITSKQIINIMEKLTPKKLDLLIETMYMLCHWIDASFSGSSPEELYNLVKNNFPDMMWTGVTYRYIMLDKKELIKNGVAPSKLKSITPDQLGNFLSKKKDIKFVSWTKDKSEAEEFSKTYSGTSKTFHVVIKDKVTGVDIEKLYNWLCSQLEDEIIGKKVNKKYSNDVWKYYKFSGSDEKKKVEKEKEILTSVNFKTFQIEKIWIT